MYCTGLILCQGGLYEIEKDAVTFEMPDADFVAKFGMQAAADMVLDFHCFHPQLPFLYDARQLAAFLSTSRQKLLYYARHTAAAYHPVTIPKRNGDVRILSVPDARCVAGSGRSAGISSPICLSHRRPPPIGRAALSAATPRPMWASGIS